MINIIDIQSGELDTHVDQALQWIKSGLIIAAPLENGYAYVADAFDQDAVRAMHVLRGDALGVAAQVMISGQEVIEGITRNVSQDARALMSQFWPGQISFQLSPQRGLSWDLGDAKRLIQISVRVPSAQFLLALLRKSGPLAVASASLAGQPPILDVKNIEAREYDLAGIFDAGILAPAQSSTVVSDNETGIEVVREGAVSVAMLQEVLPEIIVAGSSTFRLRE